MTPAQRSRLFSRLWVRLATMLGLALLPIAIVAFLQTNALNNEVRNRAESGMLGATLRAAETETALIRRSQGIVASAAQAVSMVWRDDVACSLLMRRMANAEPAASLLAFVPLSRVMTCSTKDAPFDLSQNDLAKEMLDAKSPKFIINRNGPISGTSVLGISQPAFDLDGSYIGYVSMSLPHESISSMQAASDGLDGGDFSLVAHWTFDSTGEILTASTSLDVIPGFLPKGRPMISAILPRGEVFQDVSMAGQSMTYAVVPIVENQVYLMSSWQPAENMFWQKLRGPAFLAPAMLLVAGLIFASFAAEHLVARHIRELNRSIRRIADGDRSLQILTLTGAPVEITELADGYREMVMSIIRSEAALEDVAHQKEVLLREVHHRVKNNLQLIASIMSLQLRRAHNPETRAALKGLQDRILSLATIHRGLYQTSGMADVNTQELLSDIIRQIVNLSTGREKPFHVITDIAAMQLVPDQAVPLSLLLTEALTNAIKYAGANPTEPGTIRIKLAQEAEGKATLEVWNSKAGMPEQEAEPGSGLGGQLVKAFVQQLGATSEVETTSRFYALRVTFRLAPLSAAEHDSDSSEI